MRTVEWILFDMYDFVVVDSTCTLAQCDDLGMLLLRIVISQLVIKNKSNSHTKTKIMMTRSKLHFDYYNITILLILVLLSSVLPQSSVNGANDTTTATTTTTTTTKPSNVTTTTWWKPKASDNITWQWQLSNSKNINTSYNVQMYDVDLFDVSNETIQKLHEMNRIVICYFSAGTYEQYRNDWSTYFTFIKPNIMYKGTASPFGKVMADWDDERWLDIRRIDLLKNIMISRLQLAKAKQCDGVEPDNMDVYTNKKESGLLKITYADQLRYNKFIANEAHKLNLSVGIKNDLYQLKDLINDYDWALNEECFEHNECYWYRNFTNKDKAVFGVEYSGDMCTFCKKAIAMKLSWLRKRDKLDAWRRGCEDNSVKKQCGW
jgi:endo-alpha-1,4-polygalactosaminidase (GH114 family)